MSPPSGRGRPAVSVGPGERVLAWCRIGSGEVLAGTRDAFYGPNGLRVAWERVEAAGWDADAGVLTVSEVGTWGRPRPEHSFPVEQPGRLLELVRERVTASVVLQRHVAVHGRRGLRVIARRAPAGDRRVSWLVEYDAGVDPDDPVVRDLVREALARARGDVGLD